MAMILNVVLSFALTVVACSAFAGQVKMPTQAEMKEARSAIRDLVSTGTSISELMSLADETNSGAEKYCLYVEVFKAQAKKEQYADAAETIKRIKEEISGVPESEIVKLIDQHAGKSGNEIPELKAIYQLAHSKMKAEKFVSQIKVELNKNPKDRYLQKSLGEALAISGDWESALTEFAKCDDEVSARAKAEVKGELDGKLAAFWWEYKADKRFGETGAFKAHAAELYAKLMDGDTLSVIERKVAEKRVSYVEEFGVVIEEDTKQSENKANYQIIANTNGLLHRWTFNDTLEDECGSGMTARLYGNARMSDGQVRISGGNSAIDKVIFGQIPNEGLPLTIEMWVTPKQIEHWSRIFSFGSFCAQRIDATWSWGSDATKQQLFVSGGCDVQDKNLMPFEMDKEYHLAFVLSYKTDLRVKCNKIWYYKGYKQDAKTGRTLGKFEIKLTEGWDLKGFPSQFEIGSCFTGNGEQAANASYNEVRVWKRALSERELADNAKRFYKAGETMKPAGKPASTIARNPQSLAAMAKLCNTKDLIHCWRFNGDLIDCVTGKMAILTGGAKLRDKYIEHEERQSNVILGENTLPLGCNCTIELWVSTRKINNADRMFMFGRDGNNRLVSVWNWKGADMLEAIYNGNHCILRPCFGPFEMNVEYHLAFVLELRKDGGWDATAYKQDAKTGETITKRHIEIKNGWSPNAFNHKDAWLGGSYWGDGTSPSSYNEVRIWSRALSEEELTKNAIKFHKAGETANLIEATIKSVSPNRETSSDFGTLIQ